MSKTRSLACELLQKNKVSVNGSLVKPSKEVQVSDLITISIHSAKFSYKVLQILDKRIGAALVPLYIADITPQEEILKLKAYQEAQREYRSFGAGKPTKKDRRLISIFKEDPK